MNRHSGLAALLLLGTFAAAVVPAGASDPSDPAIVTTNSAWLKKDSTIAGDVVVNDASQGATLIAGVELQIDAGTAITKSATADSIGTEPGTPVPGEGFDCNELDGIPCDPPLALPVFESLPTFLTTTRELVDDVLVGRDTSVTLDEGAYRDVTVERDGTVHFTGGIYDVRSITGGAGTSFLFAAPTVIKMDGKLFIGNSSTLGPEAGSDLSAADIVIFVAGANADPFEVPAAAFFGGGRGPTFGVVEANLYAPNGTVSFGAKTQATGAFVARDLVLNKNSTVTEDGVFVFGNQPPSADGQDVFTEGAASLDIVLTASDPDNDSLDFAVVSGPSVGSVGGVTPIQNDGQCSETPGVCSGDGNCPLGETCVLPPIVSALVTYAPNDPPADETDSFTFEATDPSGNIGSAEIRINPAGDPTLPPNLGSVVANPTSGETFVDTPIQLTLTGEAPCENPTPGEPPPPTCLDGAVYFDLTFTIVSGTGPTDGILGTLTHVPGTPQWSATVDYTPNSGFIGYDSFYFQVEADLNGDLDTLDPGERATAKVDIGVQELSDPRDPTATDVQATIEMDTEVMIPLAGTAGDPGGGESTPTMSIGRARGATANGPSLQNKGSSFGGAVARSRATEGGARIDFGVTADDFGNTNDCPAVTSITTQYVETQNIVFGTAVDFPAGPVPNVIIRSDSAVSPPCRSSGDPAFATDWWAQFRRLGEGEEIAGVNQFSAEVGYADAAGDDLVDMIAYDIEGNILDEAFTTATPPTQTLTVTDPAGEKSIAFVRVVSSNDPGGLSIDLLDYDDPVALVGGACGALTFAVQTPPQNGTVADLSQLTATTAEVLYTPDPGFLGTDSFSYSVTDCFGDVAIGLVDLTIIDTSPCVNCYTIETTVDTTRGDVTSNPLGISCGGQCSADFATGTPVTLQARPVGLFEFASWSGECSGSDPILTVDESDDADGNEAVECTANFVEPN